MAQKKVDLKEYSKQDFVICEDQATSSQNLQVSALLRIADSLEIITKDKETLIKRAKDYKDLWQKQCDIRAETTRNMNSKIRKLQKKLRIIKKNK
jgi:hypothetical protein